MADHTDALVSMVSLAVTAGIGSATVWATRRRDKTEATALDKATKVDELATIGSLATDIAREIVAGSDDVIAQHRAEVAAEMDALREHVRKCDELTELQGRRIADLESQLGP